MDALPITECNECTHRSTVEGKFHGCGHDGHATMLLGAAQALAAEGGFDGTVYFVFQPDEENGRGAQAMIDDGLFERFPMDAIFGLHNLPGLPVGAFATRTGAFTAFEEIFTIEVEGRGGHASSPQHAIDPLVIGSEIILALQTIVARALSPGDFGVVSATEFITDGARNILPGNVTIRGDTRGYDDAVSTTIERRMRALVEGIGAAHGARARLHYEREFEPTINTASEVRQSADAARSVAGTTVDDAHAPMGFSEDFARFLRHRPGCFMLLGNGTEGPYGTPLHNPGYDFNDAALPWGIEYWTRLVRARLSP
jgi:hippurate hydrolase